MLNNERLKEDLNNALDIIEMSKDKIRILKYLRLALSYAGALDHPQSEKISEKIKKLEKTKGRIISEDLRELHSFCKTFKV